MMKEAIVEACTEDTAEIVVDLHQVPYMASAGLNALLAAHKALKNKGCEMRLRRPSDRVRRVLEITDLVEVFQIED